MQKSTPFKYLATAIAVAALAACGGGGSSDDSSSNTGGGNNSGGGTTTPAVTNKFTQTATWQFTLPAAGQSVCYDFDAKAEVAGCSGANWDIKLTSSGRTAALYTNSGPSGSGKGAALGSPFTYTWAELQAYTDATIDPTTKQTVPDRAWMVDSAKSVFTGSNGIQSAVFEYDLTGNNQLHPNFNVFLVTTNSDSADVTGTAGAVFPLQVTGYYGSPTGTTSGWPTFRWIDSSKTVQTAQVNASAGWVYYDLEKKAETTESGTWHIAFNRYTIKLNGGASGSAKVAGFLSKKPAGFYDAEGKPVTSKFTATSNLSDTLADLTGALTGPASANAWVKDTIGSALTPDYTGTYPNPLNYGWFTYYPTAATAAAAGVVQHQIKANPDAATLVKSGEGNSYARMRLAEIKYADPTSATSAQTWKVEFGVQPAN